MRPRRGEPIWQSYADADLDDRCPTCLAEPHVWRTNRVTGRVRRTPCLARMASPAAVPDPTVKRAISTPEHVFDGVLWAVSKFVRERQLHGIPIPPEVLYAHRWLTAMSVIGLEFDCPAEESEPGELIGAEEAARLLGCSTRHVRRLAADLDGVRPSGRHLVFRRRSVIEYANARKESA